MSDLEVTPDPVPVAPVVAAEAPFADVIATVKGDSKEALAGAIAYLETAEEAAKTRADTVVSEVTADVEKIAFETAQKHGFSAYLAIFKSSIDAGVAKINVGISNEVHLLVEKGIQALKALKLS